MRVADVRDVALRARRPTEHQRRDPLRWLLVVVGVLVEGDDRQRALGAPRRVSARTLRAALPGTGRRRGSRSPPCRCSRWARSRRSSAWWRAREVALSASSGTSARRSRRAGRARRGSTGTAGRRSSSSRGRCRRTARRRSEGRPARSRVRRPIRSPMLRCVDGVARVHLERVRERDPERAAAREREVVGVAGVLLGEQVGEQAALRHQAVEVRRLLVVADHRVVVLVLEIEQEHVVEPRDVGGRRDDAAAGAPRRETGKLRSSATARS